MQKAIDKYNAQKGKVGRIASLTSLFEGKTENPKKPISDIVKLLGSGIDFPPSVVTNFKHLKKLLAKAKRKVTMTEYRSFDPWYFDKHGKLHPLDLSPIAADWDDD